MRLCAQIAGYDGTLKVTNGRGEGAIYAQPGPCEPYRSREVTGLGYLQDSCATDCAMPAMAARPTQFGTRGSQDRLRMPFRDRTSRLPRRQSAKPPRPVQDQVGSQRRLP